MRIKLRRWFILLIFALTSCSPKTDAAIVAPPPLEPISTATLTVHNDNELYSTDPTTVKLASGGLQLVEFFSFT